MLDALLRERFGRRFRHYEHSLRVVDVLERDGAGSTSPSRCATASSATPAARPMPRTLEGRIVRLVDRVAYINHDIDDALRAGVLDEADLPASRSRCWATRARSGSTRSCTTWSSTPSARATSSRATEAGAAMDALRDFMFERVYLGAGGARASTRKIERVVRTLFDHYCEHPDELPAARRPAPTLASA